MLELWGVLTVLALFFSGLAVQSVKLNCIPELLFSIYKSGWKPESYHMRVHKSCSSHSSPSRQLVASPDSEMVCGWVGNQKCKGLSLHTFNEMCWTGGGIYFQGHPALLSYFPIQSVTQPSGHQLILLLCSEVIAQTFSLKKIKEFI